MSITAEFHADFWVAAAAGAPVIALGAVVQFGEALRALDRATRRFYESEASRPPARDFPSISPKSPAMKQISTAWAVDFFNILVQAGLFIFSLIVLGQRNNNLPFAILLAIAIIEGIGIVALVIATALTANTFRAIYASGPIPVERPANSEASTVTDPSPPTAGND